MKIKEVPSVTKQLFTKSYWTKVNIIEFWAFSTKLAIIFPGLLFGKQWWWGRSREKPYLSIEKPIARPFNFHPHDNHQPPSLNSCLTCTLFSAKNYLGNNRV